MSDCEKPARRHFFETKAPHSHRRMPPGQRASGAHRRQMERACRDPSRRRPAALQRAPENDRRHLAEDADDDAAEPRARRFRDPHRVPDDAAERRLRADRARPRSCLFRSARSPTGRARTSRAWTQRAAQFDRQQTAKGTEPRLARPHCQIQ